LDVTNENPRTTYQNVNLCFNQLVPLVVGFSTLDYTYNVHRGCHTLFMSFWDARGACEILHILAIVIHTFVFFGWVFFSMDFVTHKLSDSKAHHGEANGT
jgi:hypothetical protein